VRTCRAADRDCATQDGRTTPLRAHCRAELQSFLLPLAAAALVLVGCGGDSGGASSEEIGGYTDLTVVGAEETVRLYLAAMAAGEGEVACGLLADDFEARMLGTGEATRLGAETCTDYVVELEEAHAEAGEPFAFEGQPIREPADARAVEFTTAVDQSEASSTSARVRGEEGTIVFRLDAPSGQWEIAEIIEGG
jgi:ketosteroid isomerase-like protein